MRDTLYMGIDGGGTKTEFVIVTGEGQVISRFLKGGSNPNGLGFENAASILCEGIQEALMQFPLLKYIHAGVAGMMSGNYAQQLDRMLKEKFPTLTCHIQSDVTNMLAVDEQADMALISGTGSVVYVRHPQQNVRLGGWGYLFDYAGSAYDIARDAVAASLQEEDSGQEPSLLNRMLRSRLGTQTVWDCVGKLHTEGRTYIASLAEVVFEAYRAGDAAADRILEKSAARLAELLEMGIQKHGARPCAVVGGGLFTHCAEILMEKIHTYTDCELRVSELPPVYGACRLSRYMAEPQMPKNFEEQFLESYRRI